VGCLFNCVCCCKALCTSHRPIKLSLCWNCARPEIMIAPFENWKDGEWTTDEGKRKLLLDSFSEDTIDNNFSMSKFPFLSQNRATAITIVNCVNIYRMLALIIALALPFCSNMHSSHIHNHRWLPHARAPAITAAIASCEAEARLYQVSLRFLKGCDYF
jgi:hypothetical protein